MSMRGLFGSLVAATALAATGVSAGEFIEVESGTRAEPVRLIGAEERHRARPRLPAADDRRALTQ